MIYKEMNMITYLKPYSTQQDFGFMNAIVIQSGKIRK